MNQLNTTGHQVWHVEELVCWTTRERLRLLWYRLGMTVHEMSHTAKADGRVADAVAVTNTVVPDGEVLVGGGPPQHSVSLASPRVCRSAGAHHGLVAIGP